jgi:molybdopterin-guanine dinucleotide biosynthesis protein A
MVDAIVLAGGAARRLDGVDKAGLEIGGHSLLWRAVAAVGGAAARVVVVGPRRAGDLPHAEVIWCQEEPPGGGPVAAIAAALPFTDADTVLLIAADLPWIAAAVPALLGARDDADVAVLVDAGGRDNLVAAAWRRDRLEAALAAIDEPAGCPLHRLYDDAVVTRVPDDGHGADCDTWDDVRAARARAEHLDEGTPR